MTKARDIASAAPAPSTVSSTELGYLDGVTSAIQTQIDSKIGSASAISPTLIDAKGDLIVGSAADTAARLAVGTNNHVLTADSSATNGVKWAAPAGGGETWTTWTPTMTGLTQGNGTLVARYIQVGKIVNFFIRFTFGSTSSITGLNFTLPVTPSQTRFPIYGLAEDTGVNSFPLYAEVDSATAYCGSMAAGGTYVNGGGFSGTIPFTWGNTDVFYYTGSYEVA